MNPFNLYDLMNATGGKARGGDLDNTLGRPLTGFQTDSRKVDQGDLFIALQGPNSDGHDFVETAFNNGAGAALVSRSWAENWFGDQSLLLVEDTEIALGQFAGWHAARMPARRVGVTGSSGKTTTKEMIAAALGATAPTLKNEASRNGETGVPLALLGLEETHRFAVLEMGMRGPGQIRYLAEIVRPEVGVITNIGRAHLEFLGSVENIARVKGEMLETLPSDGVAILPAQDFYLNLLKKMCPCRVMTFGITDGADIRSSKVELSPFNSEFDVHLPDGRHLQASIPVAGAHNVLNALAALSVTWALGADIDKAVEALAEFQPPAMRSGSVRTPGGALLLHDAYNANPDSMRAALEVLAKHPPRRVAILGDMLEIGATEEAEHIALGRDAAPLLDVLIVVGPRSQATVEAARDAGLPSDRVHWFPSTGEAVKAVPALIVEGDTVLLKGSRGIKMEAIADALLKERA